MKKIIHIGANKSASTTLQRALFSKSNDLLYLGEDCEEYGKHKVLLDSLVSDDDMHFCKDETINLFNEYKSIRGKKTFIYSNEDIMTSRVPTLCAERLHMLLPDAEILVIIRNQLTAIPSWYANHGAYLKMVPRRYWRRYVSFDEWMEYCLEFVKYSPLESFLYYRVLNIYKNLFGKDKIKILLFEDFINNKSKFFNELSDVLDIDASQVTTLLQGNQERSRNTKRKMIYDRFRSSFFHNVQVSKFVPFWGDKLRNMFDNFISQGKPASIYLNEYWEKTLIDFYKEDNRKLENEYCLSLTKNRYPIN